MKIALVHDYLNQFGGAERVLLKIHELFPDAPIYTSIYAPEKLPSEFRSLNIVTSPIQKMPFISAFTKHYTFVYPLVFENFNLSGYDIVISSTANFAKGIIVKPNTMHICYCHTPPRFLYHYQTEINRRKLWYLAPLLSLFDNYLRIWDYVAAQRVTYFLTNSENTARRIDKFYRRKADVIYPPVETNHQRYDSDKVGGDYYLIVSRLAQYKRIDIAIEACNRLRQKLIIIGEGKDRKRLEKMAGQTIRFIGSVNDHDRDSYIRGCKAFLFPGEDDFGITPVEAMSYGKPVIALGKGGALETVIEGKTGTFFTEESAESLTECLKNFDSRRYKPQDCIIQAEKFSIERFKKQFREYVDEKWVEFNQGKD